jgi:hypothetical protein
MLMADGVALGKLAAGTVDKFRELYPERKSPYLDRLDQIKRLPRNSGIGAYSLL